MFNIVDGCIGVIIALPNFHKKKIETISSEYGGFEIFITLLLISKDFFFNDLGNLGSSQ